MADPTTPDPAAPANGNPPAAPPPANTPPAKDDEQLGENGLKALNKEREERQKAEARAAKLEQERDALKQQTMSEQEKAVEKAKAEGRAEAELAANQRIVRSEVRAAAATKLADPEDAAALLGDLDRFITKSGEVDSKAISSAIDDLVKAKPYLGAQAPGGKTRPLPGGGATPSSGISINDVIRTKAGRA